MLGGADRRVAGGCAAGGCAAGGCAACRCAAVGCAACRWGGLSVRRVGALPVGPV